MVLKLAYLRRRVADRFFAILDSQGVAFFQAIVYMWQAIMGVYNRFIAHGVPTDVDKALGNTVSGVWLWLCMGVSVCMVGKLVGFSQRFWLRTAGLYLQFAGDLAALGMFSGYVLSNMQESKWGEPMSAPFTYTALAMCAFFLCWRDLRRAAQAEKRVRR